MFCNSGILGIPLPSVLVLQYREETSLRYVVMVAKFLDDNKRKFALFQTSSVLLNSNVGEIFSIEFERTVSEFRKRKKKLFVFRSPAP